MANSNSEHSKQLRRAAAAKYNRDKLASGELKQFGVKGRAADIETIEAAVARAGGSRVQALKRICAEWLAMQD
ncbi:hypothetical protein [Neisseria dentiae]|uniref:hypothetical protein n=1 Tax=Neisseria dentiae TaxID=194197 RepID=UPI0035A03E4F